MDINMELTLLTEGQVFGNDREKQLEVLRKYGTRSAVSDLAILTGATAYNAFVPDDDSLKGRTGKCYTRSYNEKYEMLTRVEYDGTNDFHILDNRSLTVRPVLLSSSFSQISLNRMRGYNGTEEVEFGEYPQYVPDRNTQIELEREYQNERLQLTGRDYTFDKTRVAGYFQPVTYQEYEYNEKRYVRIKANFHGKKVRFNGELYSYVDYEKKFKLSNGEVYRNGDYVWVEVSPVKWLIDDETQMLISKIGLLSGIRFHAANEEYNGDFSTTKMKEYLDKNMIKDLFQSTILKHSADMTSTELKENINSVEDMTPKKLLAEATAEFRKILAKGKN